MEVGTEPISDEGLANSRRGHRERRPEEDKVWFKTWHMGSLIGYCPWGHKESDTTERLHFLSFRLSPTLERTLMDLT